MKHKYDIEIDCANCCREVEIAINKMKEVESATLIYVDKRMIIEVSEQNEKHYADIEMAIEKLAKSVEPDFEMRSSDKPKTSAKKGTKHVYGIEIDCANCCREVEIAINKMKEVESATLIYVDKRMIIEVSKENAEKYPEIEEKIRKLATSIEPDFGMWPYEENAVEEEETNNTLIPRIAVGAIFVIFGLLLEWVLKWEVEGWDLNGIGMRVVFFIGLMVVGYDVILNAIKNLGRARFLDENFLMMVATVGALVIGEYPESVAVMMFYQIGEYFEGRAVAKTRSSVKALVNLKAPYATVERDGNVSTVKTESVQVGETVIVKPGEMVPIDGNITYGESFMDTKAMTGESVPRRVKVGDEVLSGYINTDSLIKIETVRPFEDSAASKVLSLIEDSAARKSTSEKFITKFAKYYTPAVVIGALALALIPPIFLGDWEHWINKGLIFLVVSCPCALVVSVPLSYFCGIGNASKKGILIKGSNYIEAISKTKAAVFDKTGTLTKGEFVVNKVEPVGITEKELVDYAASAEVYSNHPIAKSICKYAGVKATGEHSDSTNVSGKGVTAVVKGRTVSVGNTSMMEELGIKDFIDTDEPGTHVHVAVDGTYVGHILISDNIKEDAEKAIADLRELGVKSYMLTGDSKAVGKAIADQLKLDGCEAELLPSDKTTKLEEIMSKTEGSTAFVGDGINDAPSLARADVGCAMGGLGSDAAVEAADLVIINDMPSKVAESIKISKKTQGIVWQNIIFALAVKFAILGLTSVTDYINMWIAVFGDVGVLILAVANATRALGGFRNLKTEQPKAEACACSCGCGCGHDHEHAHSHGDGCSCGHDHEHHHHEHGEECHCGHEHHHEHGEGCSCGHDHGHHHEHGEECHCHEHEHEHHHEHGEECHCHDHEHEHDEECKCGHKHE